MHIYLLSAAIPISLGLMVSRILAARPLPFRREPGRVFSGEADQSRQMMERC